MHLYRNEQAYFKLSSPETQATSEGKTTQKHLVGGAVAVCGLMEDCDATGC